MHAYKKEVESGETTQWDELPERLRKFISPAPIKCYGCKSDSVFGGCGKCLVRRCASKKAVDSCLDCKKYPCILFHLTGMMKKIVKLEEKLPHLKDTLINSKRIKQVGVDAWLKEQEQSWKCPDCDGPFTWYQMNCSQCGRELDSLKQYNR
jgi:hypothetical protein